MKVRGPYRILRHPVTGAERQSPYPLTRQEAILEGVAKYWPMEPCPVHGDTAEGKEPVVYVVSELRSCCSQPGAIAAYNQAVLHGEPASVSDAHARGLDYYWATPLENPLCGHAGKRTLDGKCYECSSSRNNSPRQQAKVGGFIWYTPAPDDPCPKGHHAPRRVATGSCQQCEEDEKQARKTGRELPMHRDPAFADFIMDRATAEALGLKVFRTGEPCKKGHRGFRYVSTGNCIDCMGR